MRTWIYERHSRTLKCSECRGYFRLNPSIMSFWEFKILRGMQVTVNFPEPWIYCVDHGGGGAKTSP